MSHDTLFLINACSSFFMAGLIWFVQVVHYPSFLDMEESSFQQFHKNHVFRTGFVVIPPMLVELASSFMLVFFYSELFLINSMGLALVGLIWLSTFALQAPVHNRLQKNFEKSLILRLIRTNWIRTLLWSLKALLSFYGCCYFLLR
ncbi:MAG: hypothetical protein R3222_07225 [Balneolaceae bacterium]|nr:hypothetical protein [Balneolaceae bacterium]